MRFGAGYLSRAAEPMFEGRHVFDNEVEFLEVVTRYCKDNNIVIRKFRENPTSLRPHNKPGIRIVCQRYGRGQRGHAKKSRTLRCNCDFVIHAQKRKGDGKYEIRKFSPEHTNGCAPSYEQFIVGERAAGKNWLEKVSEKEMHAFGMLVKRDAPPADWRQLVSYNPSLQQELATKEDMRRFKNAVRKWTEKEMPPTKDAVEQGHGSWKVKRKCRVCKTASHTLPSCRVMEALGERVRDPDVLKNSSQPNCDPKVWAGLPQHLVTIPSRKGIKGIRVKCHEEQSHQKAGDLPSWRDMRVVATLYGKRENGVWGLQEDVITTKRALSDWCLDGRHQTHLVYVTSYDRCTNTAAPGPPPPTTASPAVASCVHADADHGVADNAGGEEEGGGGADRPTLLPTTAAALAAATSVPAAAGDQGGGGGGEEEEEEVPPRGGSKRKRPSN